MLSLSTYLMRKKLASYEERGASALSKGIVFLSFLFLFVTLYLWCNFNPSAPNFHFVFVLPLMKYYNLGLILGLDGISLCFLLLTAFVFPICFFGACYSVQKNLELFLTLLLSIEVLLFLSFISIDVLFFYVFFESILIPMFLMIGMWGSRARKIKAAYYFFLYTFFGSLFMLFGILYIYLCCGSTSCLDVFHNNDIFSQSQQLILWGCFFMAFATKIPMFPMHLWLPEAHVEAPTVGSVVLASLLLKLGGYGFFRFSLPFFPFGTYFFLPLVYSLAVVSVIYASFTAMRQLDLKRIIAYSSVAHMNLVVLGIFSLNQQGLDGAMYLMLAHGIVSAALFFCVGVLYDRSHSRIVTYFGGLVQVMPVFATIFFLFTIANMSFPGTSNFIGEILILVGLFQQNIFILFFAATGVVLSAVYSAWLYNRVIFGTLTWPFMVRFSDINRSEFVVFLPLVVSMICLGLSSNVVTELTSFYGQSIHFIMIPSVIKSFSNLHNTIRIYVRLKAQFIRVNLNFVFVFLDIRSNRPIPVVVESISALLMPGMTLFIQIIKKMVFLI